MIKIKIYKKNKGQFMKIINLIFLSSIFITFTNTFSMKNEAIENVENNELEFNDIAKKLFSNTNSDRPNSEVINIIKNKINKQNKDGLTIIMLATILGKTEIVKALLEIYPDLNIKDKKNKTVFNYALELDKKNILILLIQYGNENKKYFNSDALLNYSIQSKIEIMNLLKNSGAKIDENIENKNIRLICESNELRRAVQLEFDLQEPNAALAEEYYKKDKKNNNSPASNYILYLMNKNKHNYLSKEYIFNITKTKNSFEKLFFFALDLITSFNGELKLNGNNIQRAINILNFLKDKGYNPAKQFLEEENKFFEEIKNINAK